MLDYRLYTFIKLCDLMNYRATADALSMTQPAVTQHIQFLEKEYQCKLFLYSQKKLSKTRQGISLEIYARSLFYNDFSFRQNLTSIQIEKIGIGATKTIGDYVFKNQFISLLHRSDLEISLIIDNTSNLLHKLKTREINIALIEGNFRKKDYDYSLIKMEELVGICSKNNPLANREIELEEIFSQKLITREKGSGARAIFEQFLTSHNYSIDCFTHKAFITSFDLIKHAVTDNCGIAFVYKSIAESDQNICSFKIKNINILREFNFVYLKNTNACDLIDLINT